MYLDLHLHGAFGVDVLTAGDAELDVLSRRLEARGVSAYLPTLVPLSRAGYQEAIGRLSGYLKSRREGDGRGALPLGLHFEGPFVSRARCGALHLEHLLDGGDARAVDEFFELLRDLPGRSMVTLAPEIDRGLAITRRFADLGFLVSIGHTEASAATLDAARAQGARHMTHFGNAMRPLHHREVGPIGWGLLRDDVSVDVIADLIHLSPEMLSLVVKSKPPGKLVLISDAVPPAGLADGPYDVWGERLFLKDGAVRNGAGALAGSASLLDEAVTRITSLGVPRELAQQFAAEAPRKALFS